MTWSITKELVGVGAGAITLVGCCVGLPFTAPVLTLIVAAVAIWGLS